jgi:hypothetical protein
MNRKFVIKKGDVQPPLQVQIFNPDGSPRDLSGQAVTFKMQEPGQAVKVNRAAVPVLASQGIVEQQWQAADTDTAGQYRGVFIINGNDTFPKEGFINVFVEDTVG